MCFIRTAFSHFLNISYRKYFKVISSFFLKLFGETRIVKAVKGLPESIKSINPIQKYPPIT